MLAILFALLSLNSYAVDSLSYSGRLVNVNGSPVTGPVNLRFELSYTDDTATVICSKDITAVALTNGVFHVRLDFLNAECGGSSIQTVMSSAPVGETAAIRVSDLTNSKVYGFQALHSVPFSLMAAMAKTLERMGATTGQVLKWDGAKWAPGADDGGVAGSVTSVATGTGLSGGPITSTGTISIANGGVSTTQLADSAVTDLKISVSAAISRAKLVAGSASHVLVNDGAGLMSSVAQLPISQGGTGASSAAGARTALELGSAATADVGMVPGNVMRPNDVSICSAGEYLKMNVGPTYFWTCESDASTDTTKLPLAGGTMSGAIAMDTNKITGLGTPTAAADAATKAYVDSSVSDVSHWTLSGGDVSRSSGNVGIGTASPSQKLDVVGLNGDGVQYRTSTRSIGIGQIDNESAVFWGTGHDLTFTSAGTEKMRIGNSGNVGIGTTSPGSRLTVVRAGDFNSEGNTGLKILSTATSPAVGLQMGSDTTNNIGFIQAMQPLVSWANRPLVLQGNGGRVGVGMIAPTATLHLKAGTAALNTAPLKLTSGTNLTTPEAGAIEFDGTNLYYTDSTNTRRTLSTGTGSYASGSTIQSASGSAGTPGLSFSGDTDTGFFSSAANQMGVAAGGAQLFTFDTNGLLAATAGGGKVSTAAGSVSAPTFSFAGDTDTGWFSPAANTLAASNGGTETMRINSLGSVGIGTSTPATDTKIHIEATGADSIFLKANTAGTSPAIAAALRLESNIDYRGRGVYLSTTAVEADSAWFMGVPYEGNGFQIGNSSEHGWNAGDSSAYKSKAKLFIDTTGRVGIGTSAPQSPLEVAGTGGLNLRSTSGTSDKATIRYDSSFGLSLGGSVGYQSLGIGYSPAADISVFQPIYLQSRDTTGSLSYGYGTTTHTSVFRILATGNVGIGTTTPTAALQLKAGTATAGTAPLKLTSGTNLTTPEAGAMEFDGSILYFTTGTTRHVIPFAAATGSQTNVTNLSNGTGNITMTPAAGTGSVILTGAASTGTSSGALVVSGGVGVSGAINSSGNITSDGIITAVTSMFSPQIYGSTAAGGDIRIDGTSNASKGDVLLATGGGLVGVGVAAPTAKLDVLADAGEVVMKFRGSTNANNYGVWARADGSGVIGYLGGALGGALSGGTANDFVVRSPNGNVILFPDSGYVGVGTASPTAKIHSWVDYGASAHPNGFANPTLKLQTQYNSSVNGTIMTFSSFGDGTNYTGNNISSAYGFLSLGAPGSNGQANTLVVNGNNVGIGTTAPAYRLDVQGANSAQTALAQFFYNDNDTLSTRPRLTVVGAANKISLNTTYASGGADLSFGTAGAPNGMILKESGNVGIGTATPNSLLDVRGTIATGNGTDIGWFFAGSSGGLTATHIGSRTNTPLAFFTNSSAPRMTITTSGSVGIGTTNPDALLDVNGEIISRSMPGGGGFALGTGAGVLRWVVRNEGVESGSNAGSNLTFISRDDAGAGIADVMTLQRSTGNVGIGNNSPSKLLHVGSASVGTGLAVANFQNVDGTCTITPAAAGSGIACSSDERLKENFQDVKGFYALDRILKLQAVTYNFKTASAEIRRTGYKAQEIQKVAPEFVRQNDDGYFQVYYDGLIPWITEAIKTLYNDLMGVKAYQATQARQIASKADKEAVDANSIEIKALKSENAQLKTKNQELEQRLEKIEKALNSK